MRPSATLAQRVQRGARVGEHLDDLGHLEQPGEPQDLRGHRAFVERLLEREEQPGGATQDRAVGPRGAAIVQRHDPVGHPGGLLDLVGDARDVDLPGPFSSHGTRRLSGSGRCAAGSCPIRMSAASRIRAPERKLVYRGSFVASSPSAFANCFGNSSRLNSDAPRQA